MTTTPHTDCHHPATKAARAKCRKARAVQVEAPRTMNLDEVIKAYYNNSLDMEEIASRLIALAPKAAEGFYNNSLTNEEVIAEAMKALNGPTEAPATAPEPEATRIHPMLLDAVNPMITLTANDSSTEVPYLDLKLIMRTPHPSRVMAGGMGKAMLRHRQILRSLTAALGITEDKAIALANAAVMELQ
jgi:hypothetical protein